MRFRGGEFSTGTTGNFQPELTEVRGNRRSAGFARGCLLPKKGGVLE